MATGATQIQQFDAAGTLQTINELPGLGSATSAASLPVVIASDQAAVPVQLSGISGSSGTLPVSVSLNIKAIQNISIASVSNVSAAVQSTTTRVLITATTDCWVALGSAPTAGIGTSSSFFLPAGSTFPSIQVTASVTKIAVISNSTQTGYLSIVESA